MNQQSLTSMGLVSSPSIPSQEGFKLLLDTQTLVDCTLACNGGKLSAHKIVVSACSSYLARIIHEHPVEHPIIILPELSFEEVKTLVYYMYTGEVFDIDQINISSLLRTAAILGINSLCDIFQQQNQLHQPSEQMALHSAETEMNADDLQDNLTSNLFRLLQNEQLQQQLQSQLASNQQSPPLALKPERALVDQAINQTVSTNNCSPPKSSSRRSSSSSVGRGGAASARASQPSFETATMTPTAIASSSGDFQFKCQICQNDFQTICSFEYHMQRAHGVTSFGCEICHKPFASLRYVLTDHMRRCHGWRPPKSLSSSKSSSAQSVRHET